MSKPGKKRSQDQILKDRERVAELVLQQYTNAQIADIIGSETGLYLSPSQIGYDINKIRQKWRDRQQENYDARVNQELDRLDALEKELWQAWRASGGEKLKRTVEQAWQSISGNDFDHIFNRRVNKAKEEIARIITTTETQVGNPAFLNQIIEVQKERRKLLGMYAPSRMGIDINNNQTITVKGYMLVSPDDWPDAPAQIVDGEFASETRNQQLQIGPGAGVDEEE
jgi:hypothetical protein